MAPEILRDKSYTTKADIFSIGSILFNIFSGKNLFPGEDTNEVVRKNKLCDISKIEPFIFCYSKEGKDFLAKLLTADPN